MRKRTFLTIITALLLIAPVFAFCGGGSSAHEEMCSADCLGKMRPKAQACGENQTCKQEVLQELKTCEEKCKNYE